MTRERAAVGAGLLELVPNFSVGRDPAVVDALVAAAVGADVSVLDRTSDSDHNRSVLTLAGTAGRVADAALALARVARARIDLRTHRGVHRRMGAMDVCPFVPLAAASMAAAIATAHAVGRRLGDELELPVFFYGAAATRPERRVLGAVRNLGFEALADLVVRDPAFAPDCGPARLHPSAGAVAVGARPFLIAFNVDLTTDDVALARRIAAAVRERDGGLPRVQAMGFLLEARGCAQVSTNILDHEVTSLRTLFDRIAELAASAGAGVARGELIGLAPAAALDAVTAAHLRLADFDPARHTVEGRLARA